VTRLKLWAAALAVAILSVLSAIARARRDGRAIERARQMEADNARSDAIRDRVADARRRGVQPDDERGYRD
jgi:hypothetical protein